MVELVANNDFKGISKAFDTAAFGEALEKGYKAIGRPNKWTKKTSFAPSNIGFGSGTCPRFWFYAFHGAEFNNEAEATSIANMENGTDAGKRLANVLKEAGLLTAAEVEVKHDDPPIGGFIDAVVNWKGEEIIGEIKTTKTETFNQRATSMSPPGYQLIQLLIYMKVKNKDKGFFLIENKNTHELLIIPIKMTPEYEQLVNDVFEWMRMVKKNSEENKLPTRPFTKSSYQCKSCPVRETCWFGVTRGSVNGKDPNPGRITLPVLAVPR